MSWMSRGVPALGALALLAAAVPQHAHAGQWSHARNGFTIGFNLGVGSAGVEQTFSMGGLGMTWYPQEGGFWLKAIVGAGRAEFQTQFLGTNLEVADTGAAFSVGTGYEWRLTRSFALGPAPDLARASFDGGSADWANVNLGLNWYL